MNEAVLLKLKVIVERAVRPVRATESRKKKMREELLAHVTGVYDEEFVRCGDEAAALILAEKRFGDPGELVSTLQDSVPKRERFAFLLERLIQPRAGESLLQRAGRHGMMVFVLDVSLSIGLALLIFPLIGKTPDLGFAIPVLVLVSVYFGALCFVGTLLTKAWEQALLGSSGRSFVRISLLVIVSCFIPALLPLMVTLGASPFETVTLIPNQLNLTCTMPAVLAAPLIFIRLAKLISDETRYREEWENLQID